MNLPLHAWTVAVAALLLTACGAGHAPEPVRDAVPPGATASPAAFTQFVASLAEDDRSEPLNVDGLMPPTSETDEPLPVTR